MHSKHTRPRNRYIVVLTWNKSDHFEGDGQTHTYRGQKQNLSPVVTEGGVIKMNIKKNRLSLYDVILNDEDINGLTWWAAEFKEKLPVILEVSIVHC